MLMQRVRQPLLIRRRRRAASRRIMCTVLDARGPAAASSDASAMASALGKQLIGVDQAVQEAHRVELARR